MADEDPLGPRVRALFVDLAHAGDLSSPGDAVPAERSAAVSCIGEAGRVAEGTRVRFCLRLAGARVRQVRYRAYGCPFTLATCEWLARRLSGQELRVPAAGPPEAVAGTLAAAVGTPTEWAAALGVPVQRLGRLLIVEDALLQALGAAGGCCDAIATAPGPPGGPRRSAGADGDESMTDSG